MPEDPLTLGWYAKMMDNLASVCGTSASISRCICCPNPYEQGISTLNDIVNTTVYEGQTGFILKFGGKYSVDPGLTKLNPYA